MGNGGGLAAAVSAFGSAAKRRFANAGARGAPEDQLRNPLEKLVADIAEFSGLPAKALGLVSETTLSHIATRPDIAVTLRNALIGFIEVKAPGKGADPRKFTDEHDKKQWAKLRTLPNLVYTDGNAFSLWQNGELQGSLVRLEGDVETSGSGLTAPPALLALFSSFLAGNRSRQGTPSSSHRSARGSAGCCARRWRRSWRRVIPALPRWPANGATCCSLMPITSSSPMAMRRR